MGHFPSGTRVSARLDFAATNATQNAWHSDDTDKNMGFVYMPIDDTMLQGKDWNNLTLSLVAHNPDADQPAKFLPGPVLKVTMPEPVHYAPPPLNSIDTKGLAIGLPLTLGAVFLIVAVLFFTKRQQRRVGIGSIMGRRRGYGIRMSKRQRVGKHGATGVSGTEFGASAPTFREGSNDDIEMQSQARDMEGRREPGGGNVFRDEIERQQGGR